MTATQAPTPGPLSATAAFVEAFGQSLDRDFAFWSSGTASSVRQVLYPLWKPASEEIRLAPTAPVGASGSEREHWSVLSDLHTIKGWLHGLSTAPDLTDVVADGGVSVGDCYQQEAREFAGRLGRVIEALRPQPSGETREVGLDVFGDEVTDVQSRYIIVHQLRASADIQDTETKRKTGWATTSDRASLMRKAADTIERLALLSARPLALGSGEVEEALSCLADYDHTGRLERAVRAELCPNPTQEAEAGREALWKVVHELWQLLDDGETGADGTVTIDQARYQEVSKAMDDLEALVPDSEGPTWGGYPVNYFWRLK